jgi:flagella basal body P-ring formation protein FlgA
MIKQRAYIAIFTATGHDRVISRVFVAALLFSLVFQSANASAYQSVKSIRHVVNTFLSSQFTDNDEIKFTIGRLDPRLRLAKCAQNLQAFLPESGRLLGYTTIGLRCQSEQQWTIHVPVTIQQFKKVLVSNRNLPRGHQLSPADVMRKKLDISRLNQGFYDKPKQLKGLVLKRSILRGQQLNPALLAKPRLVQRGQTITILAKTGQVAIRVKGKALMDGRQGELVRIKNTSTNKELRGIVVAEGIVKVTL